MSLTVAWIIIGTLAAFSIFFITRDAKREFDNRVHGAIDLTVASRTDAEHLATVHDFKAREK